MHFTTATILGALAAIPLASGLGINCRGSYLCAGSSDSMKKLQAAMASGRVPGNAYFSNGQQIICNANNVSPAIFVEENHRIATHPQHFTDPRLGRNMIIPLRIFSAADDLHVQICVFFQNLSSDKPEGAAQLGLNDLVAHGCNVSFLFYSLQVGAIVLTVNRFAALIPPSRAMMYPRANSQSTMLKSPHHFTALSNGLDLEGMPPSLSVLHVLWSSKSDAVYAVYFLAWMRIVKGHVFKIMQAWL